MVTETNKPVKKALVASKPATSKSSANSAVTTKRKKNGEPTVAVFIDLDNTGASVTNVQEIFTILERKGKIVYGKLYGYTDERVDEFEHIVSEYKLETVGRTRARVEGVSVIDTRLIVDCMGFAGRHCATDIFVWAGVGDMIPIFSSIAAAGCTTITVDLPEFDCNNKYVNEKIRLFSPHNFRRVLRTADQTPQRANPVAQPESDKEKTQDTKGTPFLHDLGMKIPVLPRKKGAPEFGARPETSSNIFGVVEDEDDDDNFEDDDEDFEDIDFDINDTDNEADIDDGSDVMDALENARLLELTENMLRNMQTGKPVDKIDLNKIYNQIEDKIEKTVAPAKNTGYEFEEEIEKVEDRKSYEDTKNDFSEFGDL